MSLLDYCQDMMPDSWCENICLDYGELLTDKMIAESVQQASDFFNISVPMAIEEDWTTGVYANSVVTPIDDVLIYNRDQLIGMGITIEDGLDLVMTHECAHRALQGMSYLGFDSHQEELCCDFMAGVRAGLNGIDVSQMETSLADTSVSDTHPGGTDRVVSIEAGVAFAKEYYELYGVAPTFSECLQNFMENTGLTASANSQINLRPEHSVPDFSVHGLSSETTDSVGFVDEENEGFKGYTQSEINAHVSKAERDMGYWEAQMRRHGELAEHEMWRESEISHMKSAERKYEAAKAEYNKWKNMKPDK